MIESLNFRQKIRNLLNVTNCIKTEFIINCFSAVYMVK